MSGSSARIVWRALQHHHQILPIRVDLLLPEAKVAARGEEQGKVEEKIEKGSIMARNLLGGSWFTAMSHNSKVLRCSRRPTSLRRALLGNAAAAASVLLV